MKISIIHATRRGKASHGVINSWISNAFHKSNLEYILSVDNDDACDYEFTKQINFNGLKVIKNDNRSAVDAFNRGAEAATGDLFVCISDDMTCFRNWDIALLDECRYHSDFYLKVQDGLQPTLVTMPIFDREYYEKAGCVWNDSYLHMFCDQEATAVAIMTGKYLKSDLSFPHLHYTTGKAPCDQVNLRNNSTWQQGEQLFNERLKSNFGIESPIVPYSSIQWR